MLRNLVIDAGNTRIKAAFFDGEAPAGIFCFERGLTGADGFPEGLKALITEEKPASAIVCNVGSLLELPQGLIKGKTVSFNRAYPLPFLTNLYEGDSLGADRLALAAGAILTMPGCNVLVIDAGSCITYDFVDSQGNYHGGAISPGVQMRLRAMSTFTAALPQLAPQVQAPCGSITGKNTRESMLIGVNEGIIAEINSFINKYTQQYASLEVVLTGGDSGLLKDSVEHTFFAKEDFLLESLNKILNYKE